MSTAPSPLATPMPWDLVVDGYTADNVPFFERYAADALGLADVRGGEAILDVAAGPGTLAVLAARMERTRVNAIDFAPGMIARLQSRAADAGLDVDARVGDGMNLPYPDETFDAAFSIFGLIFFPDRPLGLRELHRVLKPGGRAVVASWVPMERVPALAELFAALRAELPHLPFGGGKAPLGEPDEVRAELAAAGFREVTVREVTHGFEVANVREFLDSTERGNAPMVLLKRSFEPARWQALVGALQRRLEARLGTGPQRIEMTALLGFGRR